jgi:CheY-like chemotaxis protein
VHPDGARILLVEDSEAVGQLATEMLIDLGYQPTWVPNAAAALSMLAQEDVRFDSVFSDVVMPGMNGIDFAHAVRVRYPGLPSCWPAATAMSWLTKEATASSWCKSRTPLRRSRGCCTKRLLGVDRI